MENTNLFVPVPPNGLRSRISQELNELYAIFVAIDSRFENIDHTQIIIPPFIPFKQLLNDFMNPPDVFEMDDLESDNKSVDTPLVSPFIDSDDESDDKEVLNELNKYGNAGNFYYNRIINSFGSIAGGLDPVNPVIRLPIKHEISSGFGSIAGGLDPINPAIRLPIEHGISSGTRGVHRCISEIHYQKLLSFKLSVNTPLVSFFLDSNDDSDNGEVLSELEEYEANPPPTNNSHVLPTALCVKVVQELKEIQTILDYINSRLGNINQFLNDFKNLPNEINMDDPEPEGESVNTPIVSYFLDSDDDSDDGSP
uniref:Uncharacterized protein n=1 Tax=Tanacetum cinerariifolium TaxID=118510 RepID=A0A6L2K691_TANCI|nr:hypothetical protein [Tanacetum cinerariifolium]